MSIFDTTLSLESSFNFDDYNGNDLDTTMCENFYDIAGEQDIALEGMIDNLSVIESLHAIEMAELKGYNTIETVSENAFGEIEVVEEGIGDSIKAGLNKVKEFLLKIWNAIKKFFTDIIDKIKLFGYNNSKFVAKNKSAILGAKLDKNFKATSYAWNFDNLAKIKYIDGAKKLLTSLDMGSQEVLRAKAKEVNVGTKRLDASNKHLEDKNKTSADMVRGEVVGSKNPITSDEFTKLLYKKFRGSAETSERIITKKDLESMVKFLDNTKNIASNLMEAQKSFNSTASKQLAVIKQAESDASKIDDKVTAKRTNLIRAMVSSFNTVQSAVNTMIRIHLSVVKEGASFAVSTCKRAMSYKK